MFLKYLSVFLISMVPLVELRGAIPFATVSLGLAYWPSLAVCVLGNLFPVPLIYFFARKVLEWGQDKRYIGKFFTRCLKKGESAGQKLSHRAGKRGMFLALLLFVGIPLPGTGALDGHPCRQLPGFRHQGHFRGRVLRRGAGRNHHGRHQHDRNSCIRIIRSE